MTKVKSKLKKATVIPALCVVAAIMPSTTKANGWVALANFISGAGTGLTAHHSSKGVYDSKKETKAKSSSVEYVVYPNGNQVPEYSDEREKPVIVYSEPEPVQQQVVYTQPRQQKVYYRIVSERKIERPGQDPIIETVYEEVPVQTSRQQQPVYYRVNEGR